MYAKEYPNDTHNNMLDRIRSMLYKLFLEDPMKAISDPSNATYKQAVELLKARGIMDQHGNIDKAAGSVKIRDLQAEVMESLAKHAIGDVENPNTRLDVLEYLAFNKFASQFSMKLRDAELDRLRRMATAIALGKKLLGDGSYADNAMMHFVADDLHGMFSANDVFRGEQIASSFRFPGGPNIEEAAKRSRQMLEALKQNLSHPSQRGGKRVADMQAKVHEEAGEHGEASPGTLAEAAAAEESMKRDAKDMLSYVDALFPAGNKQSLRDRFAGADHAKNATEEYRKVMDLALNNLEAFDSVARSIIAKAYPDAADSEVTFRQFSYALSKDVKGEGNAGRLMRDTQFQHILFDMFNERMDDVPDLVEKFKNEYNCY